MKATLNSIVSQIILLPTSLLLPLVASCLLLFLRYRRTGLTLVVIGTCLLAALSMPFTAQRLLSSLETYPAANPITLEKAQAIVVLGGGIRHDQPEYTTDTLNSYSLERIRYAAFLYNHHELPILVTGGNPSGGEAEGWVMKRELETLFNVPVRWLETKSMNTAENASFSWQILNAAGIHTIALITHAWHMPRAKQAFEHAGFSVIPAPTVFHNVPMEGIMNFIPQTHYLDLSNIAIREWVGMGWYLMRR
jgi:uncharacterized SAM-binding protein YcdF (DUF218 family)